MRKAILSLVVGLMLASAAWAQERPDDVLRAARSGDPEAQLEMGILYEFGFHLQDSEIPALAWYMLAAKQGNQKAIKRRDLLMARMSESDIERAKSQSARLLSPAGALQ